MNLKELNSAYLNNKLKFHNYINNIKKNTPWDIYTIINATLIKNPYASDFPLRFFKNDISISNKALLFLKSILKFYAKNMYLYFSYMVATIIYKIYYKKSKKNELKVIIDTFGLVDQTNQNGQFSENYLTRIYEIFEKFHTQYAILLRPYQVGKNPFKLRQFFKIINEDSKDFIFEYELLGFYDFIELFFLIVVYPFMTLRLLQREETNTDKMFNHSLIADLQQFNFDSLTRYILGKNISKMRTIEKVYSWSEFQVIERSFNYGLRKNCVHIELVGLQFFLNYEVYFNAYVDDLDYDMLSTPHKMLVNGKYYVLDREKIKYDIGVSLRYKDIFNFKGIKEEKNILLLGSYIVSDTKYMLNSVKEFDNVIFKNHPAVDIKRFGKLPNNITVSNENIYKLFETTKLVIGTASGTGVEAVSCGLSVIIMASQDNLTANPLVEYGQGKIWDVAYDVSEVEEIYKKLLDYRTNNQEEIKIIASWYRDNFFVEPTEDNIIKVFKIEKENN